MTIKVIRLSAPVDWDHVFERLAVPCHRALYDAIGTRRYSGLSAYDFWWFWPTEEERAAGATWVRCDVGMRLDATYGGRSIPADVHLGPPPYPNRESNCLFGLYPDLVYVTCHDYHNYRAAKVIELRRLADSQEQYQKQGLRCRRISTPATTLYQGPSRDEFRAGNHFGVCFERQDGGDTEPGPAPVDRVTP